jgi:hypothetical protein
MREAITYHEVVYSPSSRAKFKGLPTPELEDAWGSLWQCREAYLLFVILLLIPTLTILGSRIDGYP